jgi:hypothetical protein
MVPLDVHGRDACMIPAVEALERVGLAPTPVARDATAFSSSCTWTRADGSADVTLVANSAGGLDLVDLMAGAGDERVTLTVGGHPAVRLDRAGGPTCRIVVGIADRQLISPEVRSRTATHPPLCDLALSLAEETVAALRAS